MSHSGKWVIAVFRNERPAEHNVRSSRPRAVMELERIGKIRPQDRQLIREFLEGTRDNVMGVFAEDWHGSGWIRPLTSED